MNNNLTKMAKEHSDRNIEYSDEAEREEYVQKVADAVKIAIDNVQEECRYVMKTANFHSTDYWALKLFKESMSVSKTAEVLESMYDSLSSVEETDKWITNSLDFMIKSNGKTGSIYKNIKKSRKFTDIAAADAASGYKEAMGMARRFRKYKRAYLDGRLVDE